MRVPALVGTLALGLSALAATPANAQPPTTSTTTPTTEPCDLPPETTVTTVTATPVAATSPRPAVIVEQQVVAQPHRHFLRFRFGIEGTGGALVRGPEAAFGGLRARFGLQLGDLFAIYYQPTGLVGAFYNNSSPDDVEIGMFNNSFLAELTLFDMLQIGAGPSVDFVWGCVNTFSRISCEEHGAYLGVDGRAAVVLGGHGPGDRMGLTLSVNVHSTWYRDWDAGVSVLGGIGFEMY